MQRMTEAEGAERAGRERTAGRRPGTAGRAPPLPRRALSPSLLAALLAAGSVSGAASAQDVAPRSEDAGLPAPGVVRLEAAPVFQSWHREFGPGGAEVPLADDLQGPLLDQVFPGPGAVLEGLNADADALGFAPVSADEAAAGILEVRELNTEIRTVEFRIEMGLLDRIAADLMIPVVRTEVEPFVGLDPSGATLGGAAAAVAGDPGFFSSIADARAQLESRLESGQVPSDRVAEAQALLQASGAFSSTLQTRVVQNALLPLGGTRAGSEMEAFYAQLQSGFASFDLGLPSLSLPEEGDPGFLDSFFPGTLAADRPEATVRGWLAGETEVGLRFALIRGYGTDEGGPQLRTTVGARARLPFRDPNAQPFVDPTDLLGEPLGDGQRDLEFTLYQDVRLGSWLDVGATVRYGLQLADELTIAVRSPDRPLSLPDQRVRVERDLGDYVRARLAPRAHLNPFLSVGLEYRFWHKGRDDFRTGAGVDAPALEIQSAETRHRIGIGADYRPFSPGGDAPLSSVPELGFAWQTAVRGSGGETPAANLVTFHVRVPVEVF